MRSQLFTHWATPARESGSRLTPGLPLGPALALWPPQHEANFLQASALVDTLHNRGVGSAVIIGEVEPGTVTSRSSREVTPG